MHRHAEEIGPLSADQEELLTAVQIILDRFVVLGDADRAVFRSQVALHQVREIEKIVIGRGVAYPGKAGLRVRRQIEHRAAHAAVPDVGRGAPIDQDVDALLLDSARRFLGKAGVAQLDHAGLDPLLHPAEILVLHNVAVDDEDRADQKRLHQRHPQAEQEPEARAIFPLLHRSAESM